MKLIRAGAVIYPRNQTGYKYRLLDAARNPVRYVHGRTFKALVKKELITKQSDGGYASIGAAKI